MTVDGVHEPSALPPFPVIVGCIRSGTTLLRSMLEQNPAMAIPPESDFIARLHARFGAGSIDSDEFADALLRLERIASWDLHEEDLRQRLAAAAPFDFTGAVRAVHACYAAAQGKPRYGHKTP